MGLLRRLFLPFVALFLLVLWPLRQRARTRALKKKGWTELRLSGEIVELRPTPDFAQTFARRLLKRKDPPRVVLTRLRKFVGEVVSDPYAKGVLVRIGPLSGGWAAAAAVRAELLRIKEAGRHLVVHLENSVDNRQALIATAGSRLLMTPTAAMGAAGVAAPGLFLRETLSKIGLRVEALAHGKYKSAPEQFTRVDRSEPDTEQTKAIVDQLDEALLSALSEGRVIPRGDAEALVDAAPMTGARAKEAGFCDDVARDEDLGEVLQRLNATEDGPAPVPMGAARYLRLRTLPAIWPSKRRHIGVVRVHGAILDQAGSVPLPEQQAAVTETVVDDLRAALVDPHVAAVVLHINSRGGSVTASDAIYSAVRRLDQEKPVIACFGDVAASGGYYVGCGARAIVASPLTLTGSIGVFGLVPTWAELTERLAIGHDVLRNRKNAAMYNPWAGFDSDARAHAQREVSSMYEAFIELVAERRQLSSSEVDTVAQGRVWTGRDARQHRLLDDLGGFTAAVEQAKSEAGGTISSDPVIVTAKGPQTRPQPFRGAPTASSWSPGETSLDGQGRTSTMPPWAQAARALGLGNVFDPVVWELVALAADGSRPWSTVAYSPINVRV